MTEIQDKLVDLKGLYAYNSKIEKNIENLEYEIYDKLGPADNVGAAGQVLMLVEPRPGYPLQLMWVDMPSSVNEATVRRIVNEQLAKTKFTINDQGHLIIETPEA